MSMKRSWFKWLKYKLIFIFICSVIFISSILSRKLFVLGCGFLGKVAFYIFGKARKKAECHLDWVFGLKKTADEIKKMVKMNFVMMGRNAGDFIKAIPIKSIDTFEKYVVVKGKENLPSINDDPRGTIFLTAHLGPFDLVGSFLGLSGYKIHIIGKPLKDKNLNKLLADYRNSRGGVFVPRGQDTVKLFRVLKNNGNVVILIDQDTKVKSVFVDFFGRPASTPVGAALLALRTGARVVPLFVHMNDNFQQELEIFPEIPIIRTGNEEQDIIENTQRMSKVYEEIILKYPEQWVWVHERWKTQLSKKQLFVET